MMEQVIVIKDLATKFSNVKFTKLAELVSLTKAQHQVIFH